MPDTIIPNPSGQNASNSFDIDQIIAETQDEIAADEGTAVADLPKKEDGSVDLDALTPEERADYWKHRHDASTRGFHQYSKKVKTEIEKLKTTKSPESTPSKVVVQQAAENAETMDDFAKAIPNFEFLDEDQQKSLYGVFNHIKTQLVQQISQDPGVQHGRRVVAEKTWDDAFDAAAKNPLFGNELAQKKADFKARYYNPQNVPGNIEEIITELAKGYLFETAREIGRKEIQEEEGRIEPLRQTGGPGNGGSKMTINDWHLLQQKNPQEFARRSKEYNAQLKAGELDE